MVDIIWEGLKLYPADAAVYIRPMYWAIDGDVSAIVPKSETVGFAICLEESMTQAGFPSSRGGKG